MTTAERIKMIMDCLRSITPEALAKKVEDALRKADERDAGQVDTPIIVDNPPPI